MQVVEERRLETLLNAARTPPTSALQRFAVWLTFVNAWVLFEEVVVDRQGLWQYMPYYRVARFCIWDLGAMIVFAVIVWRHFRRPALVEPLANE